TVTGVQTCALPILEEVESGGLFGGELGGFRDFIDRSRSWHFRQQLNAAVVLEACASGDEAAHNHVFLEAAEIVHLAGDSCFGEDARGLLEAGRRDERIGRKRRLGNAEEQGTARCRAAAILDDLVVLFAEAELVHLIFDEERSITNVYYLDPAHHLAHYRLDVLVVASTSLAS